MQEAKFAIREISAQAPDPRASSGDIEDQLPDR
jgi:hypothetical protein